ncbi:MAG: hypothetical protein K8R88_05270 [Armatimonadetes bacterium]|nr:hypothetical protein [Armatimonadota bacterium]
MRRQYLVAVTMLLPTVSLANGAMGLGLERWDLRFWWAYVVLMVAAEAWLIGRWVGFSWEQSLLRSVLANLLTGGTCGVGMIAPFLHYTFAGTPQDPNPLLDSFKVLLYFSIPSAAIETWFWERRDAPRSGKFWRVVAVHLLMVPVGMAILLIPPRPYLGLERFSQSARHRTFMRDLSQYVLREDHLPKGDTLKSLATEVSPSRSPVSLYIPEFTRFATGEDWQHPEYTLNKAALGRKLNHELEDDQWVWLLRSTDGIGEIRVSLRSGQVQKGGVGSEPQ